jgi:type I restriction enzyme R subunit
METIADYEAKRISEAQYLTKVQDIMDNVLTRTDNEVPDSLVGKEEAKAFYGISKELLSDKIQDEIILKEVSVETALNIDELIRKSALDNGKPVIDWQNKSNITGKLLIEIGDYLIDEVRDKYNVALSFGEMDKLAGDCIDVAKIRYK